MSKPSDLWRRRRVPAEKRADSDFIECNRCKLPFHWAELQNVGGEVTRLLCRACYRFWVFDGVSEEVTKP
jgi:hypothetical protein